jgi:two-component system repressor protein LuxO
VVTADGSINRAIKAMQLGAYDFLVKPVAPERLMTTARNACEKSELVQEVQAVKHLRDRTQFHDFIGKSPAMQGLYKAIENVADSKATIFITGESGTGKEVTAEAVHKQGARAKGPFVAINCGAIPENLLESEIFGHLKGAFTGATSDRVGAALAANGGTLFLDEICEMDIKLQVKLLRFLQTGNVQRVGSSRTEKVDARVICATNRDPLTEVNEGRFREDLFYRLAVIPLELPPLRQRGKDITLIAEEFLRRFSEEENKAFQSFDHQAKQALNTHNWPGNVRELQNRIRRAIVMNEGTVLTADMIGSFVRDLPAIGRSASSGKAGEQPDSFPLDDMSMEEVEKFVIDRALAREGGNVPAAARALKLSPSTLYRKIERWGS